MNSSPRRIVIGSVVLAATAWCLTGSSAQAAPTTVLSLGFDGTPTSQEIVAPTITGSAAGAVTSQVLKQSSGKATGAQGVTKADSTSVTGSAMRLPTYQVLSPNSPLAITSIRNKGAEAMNPGRGTFSWQADISLDDNVGSDSDDGDNIFQRGLGNGVAQWKLSADLHKVLCGVKTTGMSAAVGTKSIPLPAKTANVAWYRATCTRTAAGVLTATVQQYDRAAARWTVYRTETINGVAGDVTMPASVPVSIGGKLNTNNTLVKSAPDQFNGVVDNVKLTIG